MSNTWTVAIATQFWTNLDRKAIRGVVDYGTSQGGFRFRDIIFSEDEEVPVRLSQIECDGAIINMTGMVFEGLREQFPAIPMVNIGVDVLAPEIPSVCAVRGLGSKTLLSHLREQGYRRFAYVGPEPEGSLNLRAENLRELLRADEGQLGVHSLSGLRRYQEDLYTSELIAWLKSILHEGEPTGILAYDAYHASAVVAACRQLEWEVPRQVGVVSYVEEQACLTVDPAITSIEPAAYEMGSTAIRVLHQMLRGEKPAQQSYEVGKPTLVVRGSSCAPDPTDSDIEAVVRFMESHVEESVTIDDCLAHVGTMSRATFYRSFCRRQGMPPAEYLRTLKIKRAKELLVSTPLTITRIAGMCGFSNLTQFGDTFKRLVGQTPRQYRESMSQAAPPK